MANSLILSEIATFAERYQISPEVAYTLPSIFDKAAEMAGQPVRAIISQATYTNKSLGDYLKDAALQVALQDVQES